MWTRHQLLVLLILLSLILSEVSSKKKTAAKKNRALRRKLAAAARKANASQQVNGTQIPTRSILSTISPPTRKRARVLYQFRCTKGRPVSRWQFCNENEDCSDGSDEIPENCTTRRCQLPNVPMMSCNNLSNRKTKSCLLPKQTFCNEAVFCLGKNPCTEGCATHFLCPDGECKKRSTVCDFNTCNDCKGLDRWKTGHGFKCSRNGGKCNLPQILLHDGVKDCDDGSDLCYATDGGPLTNNASDIRNSSFAKFNTTTCFQCLDKSMIVAATSVCDGLIDCPDMTDECLCEVNRPAICNQVQAYVLAHKRTSNCSVGELVCSDGSCVKRNKVCDGIVDCKDAMDEQFAYCGGTIPCKNAATKNEACRCSNMAAATCFQKQGQYCNERADCIHRTVKNWFLEAPEDECNGHCHINGTHWSVANTSDFNCMASMWQRQQKSRNFTCWGGTKIKKRFVKSINQSQLCDGILHCPMSAKTDEDKKMCKYRFPCKTPTGISIGKAQVCDGFKDCSNGADEKEAKCGKKKRKRFFCSALGGRKVSIDQRQICDFTINCDNQADEANCSTTSRFYCENKQPLFVRKNQMYNGIADCTDWSDECPTLSKAASANVFSSRYELIANPILRILVWIMGILALGGNLGVFFNELHFLCTTKSKAASLLTNHALVLNLAMADILMGIYLIMLGVASVRYQGTYCSQDHMWRSSSTCSAMGVLVVLSSETSVMTMVLLTVFRLYAVYNPINATLKPKPIVVTLLILLMWTFSFVLALVPLSAQFQRVFSSKVELLDLPFFKNVIVDFSVFQTFADRLLTFNSAQNASSAAVLANDIARVRHASSWYDFKTIFQSEYYNQIHLNVKSFFGYYSANSVCIPKILVTTADNAWTFSFLISLLNFLSFSFVTIAYIIIYRKSTGGVQSKSSGKQKKKKVSKQIKAVQRKIFRLILTDFCCWVPISIMAFLKLGGVELAPVAYAVAAIVLLPINSALNPIVYSNLFDKAGELCTCKKEERNVSRLSVSSFTQGTSFRRGSSKKQTDEIKKASSSGKRSSGSKPENVYKLAS